MPKASAAKASPAEGGVAKARVVKVSPGDRKLAHAGKVLHDDVGPLLSAAGLRLQLLRMDHPDTAERVREVTETLDQAIDRVRELSQELNPSPISPKKAPGRSRD